jgi:hypothetical protein
MKFWGWQMGRKLTVTLAIALLMFVLVPMASADLITVPEGILVIPDGSQVTSVFNAPEPPCFQAIGVGFAFQGGTGTTSGCFDNGDGGGITFTVPVTNLSLTAMDGSPAFEIFADGVGVYFCEISSFNSFCPGTVDLTLSGLISDLSFASGDGGFAGIESLSFTAVDAGDPPTSSLIFLGVGLIGLSVSSRRKVTVRP